MQKTIFMRAATAWAGVHSQAERLQDWSEYDSESEGKVAAINRKLADALMLIYILADLAKVARVAAKVTGNQDIDDALIEFEKAVPTVKDIRDVATHWNDYAQGKGRLQDTRPEGDLLDLGLWHDGEVHVIHVGALAIDVGAAVDASRGLFHSVMESLDVDFVEVELDELPPKPIT